MTQVIPGAFGYGMNTRASYASVGTDPTVYRVTSLSDSGAGTLRAALEASGPRVVIFERSGYITIASDIVIGSGYLHVAGQTAPDPGITVRASSGFGTEKMLLLGAADCVFQHFAIRPGADSCNSGLQVYPGGTGARLVFDHMSFSWGQDDNAAVTSGVDISFWRCLFAEGLYEASGSGACSGGGLSQGHGLLLTGFDNKVSVVQCLFARCLQRTPQINGSGTYYIANNVTYAGHEGHFYEGGGGGNILSADLNNYFKRDIGDGEDVAILTRGCVSGDAVYRSGNVVDDGGYTPAIVPFEVVDGMDPTVGTSPVTAPTGASLVTAGAAYTLVTANAGARPAARDDVDTRIVAYVNARSSSWVISDPGDVGGYPTLATNTRALTTPANPHVDSGNGYTNLEVWLQGYAAIAEGTVVTPALRPALFYL